MRRTSAILWLLSLAAYPALAADRMQGGKWESAVTADGQTKMLTYCVTKEEAASINGDTRTAREFAESKAKKASEPCTFKSYEVKGDEVSYTMVCGTRTINDRTVYHGISSEGVKTITKEGQTVTMRLNSRRVGENCL